MRFIVARLFFLIKSKCQTSPQMEHPESFNLPLDSKHRYCHQPRSGTGTFICFGATGAILKSHIINLEFPQLSFNALSELAQGVVQMFVTPLPGDSAAFMEGWLWKSNHRKEHKEACTITELPTCHVSIRMRSEEILFRALLNTHGW